jgi:putative phosphoesterase
MLILLVSDTHGNISDLRKVISNYDKLDLVVHLGDCVKDVYKVRSEFPDIPFELVAGNNDWASSEPNEKIIEINGKRILMTHGHNYGVKTSTKKLVAMGRQNEVDAVFFGHTHLTDEFYSEEMIIINPGSLGRPSVYQGPTFCEVRIENNVFKTTFRTII